MIGGERGLAPPIPGLAAGSRATRRTAAASTRAARTGPSAATSIPPLREVAPGHEPPAITRPGASWPEIAVPAVTAEEVGA